MTIKRIIVGELKTNCYILNNEDECLIIDPGDDYEKIVANIGNQKVVGCLITHSHPDHIGALEKILKKYNLELNKIKSKQFPFIEIETKGHTLDSKTFYFKEENIIFTGDFLFKGGIGRTDLGGNEKDMKQSLEKIKEYPNHTIIYPGHGPSSLLGEEKNYFSFYY